MAESIKANDPTSIWLMGRRYKLRRLGWGRIRQGDHLPAAPLSCFLSLLLSTSTGSLSEWLSSFEWLAEAILGLFYLGIRRLLTVLTTKLDTDSLLARKCVTNSNKTSLRDSLKWLLTWSLLKLFCYHISWTISHWRSDLIRLPQP